MRILVLFARHGTERYPESLSDLDGFYQAHLPSARRDVVVVDNAGGVEASEAPGVIAGSNRSWEFSAWDEGLASVGDLLGDYDLVHLVTSAFRTLYVRYIERLDLRVLQLVAGRRAAVGHIDRYDEPIELMGHTSQSWLRSSFVFVPPAELVALGSLVGVTDASRFFSGDARNPFRATAPLSENYRQFIRGWLTGEGTGQGTKWHSRFALSPTTLPLFESKALAILNEHMLAIRLRLQGCELVDATWLATRANAGATGSTLGVFPPWQVQLAGRDTDPVPLTTRVVGRRP